MNNSIAIVLLAVSVILMHFSQRIQNTEIDRLKAEQTVLRTMFTTKVDYLNHLSWRHEYAETLREELERFEREAGVK